MPYGVQEKNSFMSNNLNKLQIKRIILDVIDKYESVNDFRLPMHKQNMKILNSINAHSNVVDILLKEFYKAEDFKNEIISFIISDFASLEDVEEKLWAFLQDKTLSDNKKQKILSLLRTLGGKIDTTALYDYLEDFDNVVNKETQDLLETATINMEAQIDFIDFMSTLPEDEQIMLLNCLKEDYDSDQIVAVFAPCLKYTQSPKIKELIIEILGASKSYMSVESLKFVAQNSHDEKIRRLAIKALNQLKKDGIDIEDNEKVYLREKEICSATKFYKAYISEIDGSGEQGAMFSRINENGFIEVFSVVLSVTEGIVDCFGFSSITKKEFQKVLNRFRDESIVVQIPAGELKYRLNEGQKINIEKNFPIPYEYICWSAYLYDIEETPINYEKLFNTNSIDLEDKDYKFLYENEIFDTWFFEYGENKTVDIIIREVINSFEKQQNNILDIIENIINNNFENIFTEGKKQDYSKMLVEQAFIFNSNKQPKEADLCYAISKAILNNNNRFLKDILKRTIIQYISSLTFEEENKNIDIQFQYKKEKPVLLQNQAIKLLNILIKEF